MIVNLRILQIRIALKLVRCKRGYAYYDVLKYVLAEN